MSNDIAIKVQNLSKQYQLGEHQQAYYNTLRESVMNRLTAPFQRRPSATRGQSSDKIWALKDVSFEIQRGEVVGIIGRNGAGKTTLLKILSRITEPTEGRAEIHGRVGSLLEVGTGFHPELTGRENVFLNGAILGMRKAEIKRKFDEIVAFAEVNKFIDTPVKRYSSGMYVRLAFSVAAHMEPEILLVDEVLAVGDAAFQNKCFGKMGHVAGEGRTVLFVSHNMSAISRLCSSCILVSKGRISLQAGCSEVIAAYLDETIGSSLSWQRQIEPSKDAFFQRVYLTDYDGQEVRFVATSSSLKVVMEYTIKKAIRNVQLSVGLLDSNGDQIFGSAPQDSDLAHPDKPGLYRAAMSIPPEILLPKIYSIRTALWVPGIGGLDRVDLPPFSVQDLPSFSNATPGGRPGKLAIKCEWSVKRIG